MFEDHGEKVGEFPDLCSLLESAKVTDRKDAATKILNSLSSPAVLKIIDENSVLKRKRSITWDRIFESVQVFVEKELSCIGRLTSTLETRQKTVVSFVRTFVKKADDRGPRLKGQDVVLHFLKIIKDPDYNQHIGVEYCKLLKSAISVSVYQCDISAKTWQDLIDTFVSFMEEKPPWLSRKKQLLASIIYLSVESASALYTLNGSKLFKFFENVFKEIWNDGNPSLVEYFLYALNAFVKSCADDCRGQVCRLGETLFPLMLQMWKKTQPVAKDQLIQFMRLQVCAHHPQGVHEGEHGAWSSSVNHWKKCLQRLYSAIVDDIEQLKKRVVRTSSVKLDPGFAPHFIELAADVFHQVFWAQSNYHSISTNQDSTEPGAKRQKIELGWQFSREVLENSSENLVLLSWLQILPSLFCKHPSSIPATEFQPFFLVLHQLQTKHKRHETIQQVLRSVEALVQCFAKRKCQLEKHVIESIKPTLKQIWVSALRIIGIKHVTDSGFSLLIALLKEQVHPDPDIFVTILGSGVPSRISVEFLYTYLVHHHLPEKLDCVSTGGFPVTREGSYPLRHQLFNWMLPIDDGSDTSSDVLAFWAAKSSSRLPNMPQLATVLVALTQKFPTTMDFLHMNSPRYHSPEEFSHDAERALDQMQEVYLKSTFDKVNIRCWNGSFNQRKKKPTIQSNYNRKIDSLCILLCDRLSQIATALCENLEIQSSGGMSKERLVSFGGRIEGLVRFCCLACQVMVYLIKSNSLTQEEVENLPVKKKIGNLLNKVADGVSEISKSHDLEVTTRMEVLTGIISELERMFTVLSETALSPELFCGMILREKTPRSLLSEIVAIYSGELAQTASVNSGRLDITERSFVSQSTSVVSMDETDGFDDFESDLSSSDELVTIPGSHSQSQKKGVKSAYSTLRESSARFLCKWSMQDGRDVGISALDHQPNDIKEKVVSFFNSEEFNISKDGDLKLYFTVSFALASSNTSLPSHHLEVLLDVFRQAMSKYRKDQKVCCQGLKLLVELTRHLSDNTNLDSDLQSSREIAAHILKAFWTLKDTQYSPIVRLHMAKCMETFLKLDPEENWCGMKQVKKDRDGAVKESSSLSLSEEFPKLLGDSSHLLRTYMASAIKVLFVRHVTNASAVPAPRDHQYEMFERVAQILVQSLTETVAETLSEEEREDEGVNRSSSMLACLKQIALISPICEKRAIALLFQAVKEQFLNKDLVKKVLAQLACELGYTSRAAYVKNHLEFIIDDWLKHDFKITDFPCEMLDFKRVADFFQYHHSSILPSLISRPETAQQSVALFTEQLVPSGDCREFVRESFCHITAYYLPWFAQQSRIDAMKSSEQAKIAQARKSYDFLVSILTEEAVDKLFAKKFDEQIVSLLLRMYEPTSEGSDLSQFTKETDPEPDPPFFTSHAIKATFDYLTSCHPGAKSIVSILCTSKDSIQKILLELSGHLHVIVSTLTPYALGEGKRGQQAFQLLNFLILDSSKDLRDTIRCLDPFPDTMQFKQINKSHKQLKEDRTSLLEEITHFLSADSNLSPETRLEGLRLVKTSIIKNKHQLVDLVERTEVASSKPPSSTVADLVHGLIKLGSDLKSCQEDQAKAVQYEVATCLGEIGAVDLSTVSLRRKDAETDSLAGNSISQRNSTIVCLLNSYLVDKSVQVVTAAASCLKQILATESGFQLLKRFDELKQEQLLWYLEPFKSTKKRRAIISDVKLDDANLWIPGLDGQEYSHEQWITKLACTLIESGLVKDEVLFVLSPICRTKVEFAEHVFPYLVHNVLECDDDVARTTLSDQFRNFFSHCNGTSVITSSASSPFPSTVPSSNTSGIFGMKKESVRTMLAVVTYLRTQNIPRKGRGQATLWDNNFWLDLDYLEVASAAQRCSAYFTALLYTEVWADIEKSKEDSPVTISLPSNSQNLAMEIASSQNSEGSLSTSYQTLILEAYGAIGEPDSVYGAGAGRLADIDSRIRTYMHEHAWDKALGACDLRMQNVSVSSQTGLLQAMKNFGLDHVMRVYLKGLPSEDPQATDEVAELQYESAWQNCVWDLDTRIGSDEPQGFHQALYGSLCALQEEEWELFQYRVDNSKLQIMDEVAHVSLESVRSVYPALTRLQCVVELESFGFAINGKDASMVEMWNERFPLPDNDFEFLEPLLALRTSMLQTLVKLRQDKVNSPEGILQLARAYKDLATHLEMQAKVARRANNPQVAEKALFRIRQLQSDITDVQSRLGGEDLGVSWSWKMEEAKLRWAKGEQDTAMYLLKSLGRQLEKVRDHSPEASVLYPQALGLYGTWLAESKSENPNTIIEDYLEKAACLMECMEGGNDASRIEAFLSLAWFADTQYQKKVDFMSSSTYENKEALMKKAKVESERLQRVIESGKDRYARTLNLQAQMDERELQQVVDDKRKFLKTAVEYYIKTLQTGDKYDMRVFRLCSLWFDNAKEEFVSQMIKEGVTKIESRKCLPLMYQLAARLGTKSHDNPLFQSTLNELIERTAVDHPHHTLFILFALANAEKDNKYLTGGKKTATASRLTRNNSKEASSGFTEARIKTACELIDRIGKQRGELVHNMRCLCEAYIELAYVNVQHLKNERGPFNLQDVTIKRISNLKEVPVPTLEVEVDPLCRYDDLVHVVRFDSKFCLAGGVNLPKIIFCIGSDGVKRRQLVKGRDDLRQDAVMEQVFGMVNQLLIKNSETRKRKLKMRTYKVIPLSQRSGIVEWCEDTMPLGEYLVGRPGTKTGAHSRYCPGDWTSFDCRKRVKVGDDAGRPRYEVYQELMEHFHPVFRHFFLERFPDPAVWFERRLTYTRGVATSSIVGYVVGLGDRHVQNILVDCNTAELVHIDLGVAFEQGKFLPTPETVPFRLTRDLVDGMGLTGVEGVFRRCCEKTMQVMRTSQESLMTIVEVLLYDPLSSWTLSPERRKALQKAEDLYDVPPSSAVGDCLDGSVMASDNGAPEDNVNKMAKRVLLRLKQKLDGIEDGVHLSVSGQVNHLIREAMDPKNLCRLFPGWQPWV
ncbi:unnamed protein product [Porites lobata]|uniref:non-specific serine/threonine protein kinase n=1 Tax=Porites lobata TaxID=104759 RepID=A0ABN8MMV1_9CNID|nr:unnamed protein product [Porites lobata]